MSEGFQVDVEQLRAHAAHLEQLHARFDAVRSASSHIDRAEGAYGLLCDWIPRVLEDRHEDVDDLVEQASGNVKSHVEAIRSTADDYEAADAESVKALNVLGSDLGTGASPRGPGFVPTSQEQT